MNKELLKLAIPNIISNITVPLLSTVDTALMGRLSPVHIGAVGLGSMLFNYVYWNFGFLRMGATGLTAQAYGKNVPTLIAARLGQGVLMALMLAAIILLVQSPLLELGIRAFNLEGETAGLVRDYFSIRVWAAPATLMLYALMGWFFGMQNAVYPLIISVFINVVNIVLSWWLVQQSGMGIAGAAWGTLAAQYFGVLLAAGMLLVRYRHIWMRMNRTLILQWEELKGFLQLNADLFLRTLALTSAFFFFYRQGAVQGTLVLAVNTILLQYINWMSYGVDGFAFAAESLVGKYDGAGQPIHTRRAIRLSFGWGMVLAVLFALVYAIGGDALLHVFTDQTEVHQAAQAFLIWMVIFPLLGTPCYILDGIFIGLTAGKAMRNTMLLAFAGYLLSWWLTRSWGNHGLWFSLTVLMVLRALFLGYLLWRDRFRSSTLPV